MKIIFDAYGGDDSLETVKGAILTVKTISNLTVILSGKQEELTRQIEELKKQKEFANFDESRLEILNATEVITNDDKPTEAIRTKKDSSLVKALDKLKLDEEVLAVVSAGSTGAVLSGGFMKIGRLKGVSRPALCPVLPTKKGTPVMLMDSGANMDCKPQNLVHFAIIAKQYYESMFGVENPRIALLSVGVESEKGNELVKTTYPLFEKLPINFVGNMEARDALSGDYDIIITDGFAGNVLLKSCEGAISTIVGLLKQTLKTGGLGTKIGGLLIKKPLKKMLKTFDYSNYGGSPFLGIKKIVIKAHGNSKAKSFVECARQAIKLSESKCYEKIEQSLASLNIDEIKE